MKVLASAFVGISIGFAVPALAQAPQPAPSSQQAGAPASGAKLSVETTLIGDIVTNAKARAIVEKALPDIRPYFSQIGEMTLADLVETSEGVISRTQIDAIQREFDRLN